MLQLQVIYGKDAGKQMSFQQSVVHIGTEAGNDFQLNDDEISGYHGQLVCSREGHYSYSDLQSEHGSRVRSANIDVLLYSRQMPQSVALAGEVQILLGGSIIRCSYVEETVMDAVQIDRLRSLSLLTLEPSADIDMMHFLLDTSLSLTVKTTHQAVMSHLSHVILQRMAMVSHAAIWRYDSCQSDFSCIYERSRGNITSSPVLNGELFREAIEHRNVSLYRVWNSQMVACVIVAPLVTATRQIGVLVIDSLQADGLGRIELETIARLAEVTAYAVERALYNADVSSLFDGFIRSIIAVMDARDPASSGHSRRVAKYSLMTAQAIHASQSPAFRTIQFSNNHLEELRFAGLLHDIGKVVLRREVLLKAAKLTPQNLKNLLDRISLFAAWYALQTPETMGPRYRSQQQFELYREMVTRVQQAHVCASQQDRVLIEEMAHTYVDPCPNLMLLSPSERESLLIEHGTLTVSERHEIERHALISWQYLSQIAWPQRWADVPIFVLQHHEKLNGTGYPHGIRGDQIRLQSRILTICDIFDALTGGDRPYKTRHSFGDAAAILLKEAKNGALDADIVDLFISQVIPQLSSPDISSGSSSVIGG